MTRLVVGQIGRALGVRGEVLVQVHTDAPESRFAPGSRLETEPADRGPLTVLTARAQGHRLAVRFAGVADRTAAQGLGGLLLLADSATAPALGDPAEFWDHDLVGLPARSARGEPLGEVAEVLHPPGADLLVIRRPDGRELLVPFVAALVPTVDLAGRRLVVDPPPGLLDL